MTLKYIMTERGFIGHGDASPISAGVFTITSVPSTKVLADSGGCYFGELQYTFSGGNASGVDPGTVATTALQSIAATASSVLSSGNAAIRVDDLGIMAAQGTKNGVAVAVSGPVIVADAGQSVVSAQ